MLHATYAKNKMRAFKASRFYRIVSTSAALVLLVSLICLLYSFIAHGIFSTDYIITANLVVGAFVTATGLAVLIRPIHRRDDKLIDSTTYIERTQDAREGKRKWGNEILLTGIAAVFITLVLEVVLWALDF